MPDLHHRHPAFVLSCVFGVVGVLLVVAALAFDADALYFAAIGAGALSLGAALYWRSLLVADWAARKPRPR
jgi:hypothetical protein